MIKPFYCFPRHFRLLLFECTIFKVTFPGVLWVARANLGPIGLAVFLIVRQIERPHFIIDLV